MISPRVTLLVTTSEVTRRPSSSTQRISPVPQTTSSHSTSETGAGATALPGPIAHWRLDETSGPTAVDSVGGHDGTLDGPTWVPGTIGNALDFDGANDSIQVPHDTSLILTDAFTLSAWINTNTVTTGYRTILQKGTSGNSQDYWLGMWNNELEVSFFADGAYHEFFVGVDVTAGQWYHVAATFNNATDSIVLYLGGVQVWSGSTTFEPPAVRKICRLARTSSVIFGMVYSTKLESTIEHSQKARLSRWPGRWWWWWQQTGRRWAAAAWPTTLIQATTLETLATCHGPAVGGSRRVGWIQRGR